MKCLSFLDARVKRTYRYGKATNECEVNATRPWENIRAEVVCEEDSLLKMAWLVEVVKATQGETMTSLLDVHMPVGIISRVFSHGIGIQQSY